MAPGYRASGRDRNRNRAYVDHDVFEGLPVRSWTRDNVTVAPPPTHEASLKPQSKWDVELPWGMPKDSHLLPQHSQDLLRAARSGKLYVKRSAPEEEEADVEPVLGEKPEKKEDDSKDNGFVAKAWKALPKHQEPPEIEYLAKRRKGLVGTAIRNGIALGPTMTQTKVRRTDAAGNTYVEELVIAEGQAVDGEVISQTVIPSVAAAGLPGSIPPTPQRKRAMPPKPKRKPKGPGRGRKRKAVQAPTSVPGEPGVAKIEGEAPVATTQEGESGPDGVKRETTSTTTAANEDTEIVDDSILPSDEEGEDGEEGSSEEDDDGDNKGDDDAGDDQDDVDGDGDAGHDQDDDLDGHNSEVPNSDLTPPTSAHNEAQDSHTPPPELPRPHLSHEYSGSPLKKVVTPPNYDNSIINETGEEEAEGDLDDHVDDNNMDDEMEDEDQDYPTEHQELQHPYHEMGGQMGSPDDAMIHDSGDGISLGMQHTHDSSNSFEGDDDMLLDGDMDGVDFSAMAAVSGAPDEDQDPQDPDEQLDTVPVEQSPPMLESSLENMQETLENQELAEQDQAEADGAEGFIDLLGSLEDHLNDQGPDAPAAEATVEALEEVAKAEDPDTALEEAAAVARSGEVAEAQAGGIVEEPLAAEPVVENKEVVGDVEEEQDQKAEAIREEMKIPDEARVEETVAPVAEVETENAPEAKAKAEVEAEAEGQKETEEEQMEENVDLASTT